MTDLIASLPSMAVTAAPSLAPKSERLEVPKWSEQDTPSEYFTKFEMALTLNGVNRSRWGKVLPVYLSGTAQSAFTQIAPEALADYARVKEEMLNHLGDTLVTADRRWWALSRMPGEAPGAFYLRVRSTGNRMFDGLNRDDMFERMVLSRFLSLLPQECYTNVIGRRPVNGQEAARYVLEYEVDRPVPGRQRWRNNGSQQAPPSVSRVVVTVGGLTIRIVATAVATVVVIAVVTVVVAPVHPKTQTPAIVRLVGVRVAVSRGKEASYMLWLWGCWAH